MSQPQHFELDDGTAARSPNPASSRSGTGDARTPTARGQGSAVPVLMPLSAALDDEPAASHHDSPRRHASQHRFNESPASPSQSTTEHVNMGAAPRTLSDEGLADSWDPIVAVIGVPRPFRFPPRPPQISTQWTLLKWRETMDLDEFDAKNEEEIEQWLDDNETMVTAAEPTLQTFYGVFRLVASPAWRAWITARGELLRNCATLLDFMDRLAHRWVLDPRYLQGLQRQLMNLPVVSDVAEATEQFEKKLRRYMHAAIRRRRRNMFSREDLLEMFVASLPTTVHNRLQDHE